MRFRMLAWVVATLVVLPVGQAWARQGGNSQGQNNNNQGTTHSAPEISVAGLPALAALVGGYSLFITHRRKASRVVG